jgi:hypothetical protein
MALMEADVRKTKSVKSKARPRSKGSKNRRSVLV